MNDDWPEDVPAAHRQALTEAAKEIPGMVWLGDFSGWEVAGGHAGQVELHHRCGWAETLRACGTQADFSVYVGNLIERLLEVAETHVCAPRTPSPEHQDRVARWAAAAGYTPAVAGLFQGATRDQVREALGDDAADQLDVVRALSSRDRYTDGPGCTPLQVSPPIAGRSLEELREPPSPNVPFAPIGALWTVYDEIHKTSGGTGHGPEDYPEPDPIAPEDGTPMCGVPLGGNVVCAREPGHGPHEEPPGVFCGCADPECPNPHTGRYTHGTNA